MWTQEREIRPYCERRLRHEHDGVVGDITLGKDYLVNVQCRDHAFQAGLRMKRDAVRVGGASEAGWETPCSNMGHLWRRQGHGLGLGGIPVATQKIVTVAPGRAHAQDTAAWCAVRPGARLLQYRSIN
jgi:hypothetical protein